MIKRPASLLRSIIWLSCLLILVINILVLGVISNSAAPSLMIQHTQGAAVDHVAFWAAGWLANDGAAATAYDPGALAAVQSAGLGFDYQGGMPWFYPPVTQIMTQPFALFDPFWSLVLWNVVGLAAFLTVIWRICPDPLALIIAGSAGPVFSVLFNGQIGLFISAITGMCLLALNDELQAKSDGRRAGAWLALLLLKPQTVFAIPVTLAATGRWGPIFVAILVGIGLIGVTLVVYGFGAWLAFWGALTGAGEYFMTGEFAPVFWDRYVNLYGAARANDIPFWPAAVAQGALIIGALILAWSAVRSRHAPSMGVIAILAYVCVVASPRIYIYDLSLLIIGAAFQARAALSVGWGRGEMPVLAAAFILVELGFQGFSHLSALAGPLLMIYAYWRYVYANHGGRSRASETAQTIR